MTAEIRSLRTVGGLTFRLEHSPGLDERAAEIGQVISSGLSVLSNALGFFPSLRVLVLSREDWPKFTPNPIYGLPHCTDGQTLVVAAEPPAFWEGVRNWAFSPLEPGGRQALEELYGTVDGEMDVRPFTDLMALHELGHIFHRQVPFDFPRHWLRELFANLCQYVAVAVGMPERMPYLLALPQAVHRTPADVTYTSLDDFDRPFDSLGLRNVVWYQWHLLFAARAIYERDGPGTLRRIFDASLSCCDRTSTDSDLVAWLEKKASPAAAGVMRNWPNVR